MAYAIAQSSLISDRRLQASDLRVLLSLLSFTTPDRLECWPSRAAIGERAGITSVSRVSTILRRLVGHGWIEIQQRQGSSLYRVTPPDQTPTNHQPAPVPLPRAIPAPAPERPTTPVWTTADHTGVEPEETREETNQYPLTPVGGNSDLDPEQERQRRQERRAEHEQRRQERQARQLQEAQANHAAKIEAQARRQQERQQAMEAGERLLARLYAITGQGRPQTHQGATMRLVRRRVAVYGEQALAAVIDSKAREWKGTAFERHLTPRTLFKPSALEAYLAELAQQDEQRARRVAREREALATVRTGPPSAEARIAAGSALAGIRRLLCGRESQ